VVASQPTAWRVLDAIDAALLADVQAARAKARARVWAAGLAPVKVTLDFDATLVNVHSEKDQAAGVSGGLCKGGSTIQDGGLESLLVKGE
jgi:hypothetical protein